MAEKETVKEETTKMKTADEELKELLKAILSELQNINDTLNEIKGDSELEGLASLSHIAGELRIIDNNTETLCEICEELKSNTENSEG